MNFVRENNDAVPPADFRHLQQLIPRPDASDRIVRVAQKIKADVILADFRLEIVKIHRIPLPVKPERTVDKPAAVILDH